MSETAPALSVVADSTESIAKKPARKAAPRKARPSRTKKAAVAPVVAAAVVPVAPPPAAPEPTALDMAMVAFKGWTGRLLLAKFLALIWGGIIPFMTFMVAHFDFVPGGGFRQAAIPLSMAGLLYSSKKVYLFNVKMFKGEKLEAGAFVVIVEGVMTFGHIFGLSVLSLGILVLTNWIARTYDLVTAKKG